MKKLIMLALITAMALPLAACGDNNPSENKSKPSSTVSVLQTSSALESVPEPVSEPEPEPEPEIEAVTLGKTYSTNAYEITINKIYIEKELHMEGGDVNWGQYASDGNTFIIIDSSIKNMGTAEISAGWYSHFSPFTAYSMYQNKFKYEPKGLLGDQHIAPLATKRQCLIIEIPVDVANATEPLAVFLNINGKEYQHNIR